MPKQCYISLESSDSVNIEVVGASDCEDTDQENVELDIAEGERVTFAMVEEEQMRKDARTEGGNGNEWIVDSCIKFEICHG